MVYRKVRELCGCDDRKAKYYLDKMVEKFISNMMKRVSQIKIGCAKTKQKWI